MIAILLGEIACSYSPIPCLNIDTHDASFIVIDWGYDGRAKKYILQIEYNCMKHRFIRCDCLLGLGIFPTCIFAARIQELKGQDTLAALNFKHLRYFWMVAKSGSIARASEQLHLTPQSISGQLSEFEAALGVEVFRRVGRGLELTETGQRMLSYAEQIFSLGNELLESIRDDAHSQSVTFRVGIADSVPKMVAYRLVEPSLSFEEPVKLVCREGRLTTLLADLAVHRLDMVIADRPMPDNLNVRGYDHFLGESGVSVFGAKSLRKKSGLPFPQLLDGAPFLLPGIEVALHARLLRWFDSERIHPRIVGEFDDSALMKAFGQAGAGYFVAPTAIESYVVRQNEVLAVGRIETVREQIYAITNERKLKHPIISAVCRFAQHDMFGGADMEI